MVRNIQFSKHNRTPEECRSQIRRHLTIQRQIKAFIYPSIPAVSAKLSHDISDENRENVIELFYDFTRIKITVADKLKDDYQLRWCVVISIMLPAMCKTLTYYYGMPRKCINFPAQAVKPYLMPTKNQLQ